MSTPSMHARASALRDDTRGAVMLTGLFMSFFLVGALWYVIGVGDAIIFRDRMQEATDAGAFSTAAMLAKGMNFLSACNIIMLLIVTIHIVYGVIQDATIVTCAATGLSCLSCAAACPKIIPRVQKFHEKAAKAKERLDAMAKVEAAIAIVTPVVASARGYQVGAEYGNQGRLTGDVHVAAITPANFPGWVGGRGLAKDTRIPQPKLGLPVTGEKYADLCKRVGKDVIRMISYLVSGFGSLDKLQKVIDKLVGTAVGSLVKNRYCNAMGAGTDDPFYKSTSDGLSKAQDELRTGKNQDTANQKALENEAKENGTTAETVRPAAVPGATIPSAGSGPGQAEPSGYKGWNPFIDPGFDKGWGDRGWLKVDENARNGTVAFQVWAMSVNPKYNETNERRVSIAGSIGKNGKAVRADSEKGSPYFGYFTQAEFYYDCDDDWFESECNKSENASFGLRWRARLVPLELPNLLAMVARFVNNPIRDKIANGAKDVVQKGSWGERMLGSVGGVVAVDVINKVIEDAVVIPLKRAVTDTTDGLAENAWEALPQLESFH